MDTKKRKPDTKICWTAIVVAFVWFQAFGEAKLVADRTGIREFLGNRGGILAFVDEEADERIKWVNLDEAQLRIRDLNGAIQCSNPRISEDGTRILYTRDDSVFACRISDGATVGIGARGNERSGGVAYWYRENGVDHALYCTSTPKGGYQDGTTYMQQLSDGIHPKGDPVEILDKAYDGGISSDGVWLGETYGGRHAYNRETQKEYGTFYLKTGDTEGQCCNGSMAPDGTSRFLMLVLPHDYIRLFAYDPDDDRWVESRTYTKPSGCSEWQTPEYSTHSDYFTATGKQSNNTYDLYLVNIETENVLRVVEGDIGNSHLCPTGGISVDDPYISATPSSITRTMKTNYPDPDPVEITIANTGTGTLGTLSVNEGAGWLNTVLTGEGNEQNLQVAFETSGLDTGVYHANVTISGGSASNVATFTVTLIVMSDNPLPAESAPLLLNPTGGESYSIGDTLEIRWATRDSTVFNDCDIRFSLDNGVNWTTLTRTESIDITDTRWGAFRWGIPSKVLFGQLSVGVVSENCRIGIEQYGNSTVSDISGTFSITETAGNVLSKGNLRAPAETRVVTTENRVFVVHRRGDVSSVEFLTPAGAVVWRESSGLNGKFTLNRDRFGAGVLFLRFVLNSGERISGGTVILQ